MSPTFAFDKGTQRYRYTSGAKKGQFVSIKALQSLTSSYQEQQANIGASITDRLIAEEINVEQWMREVASSLKTAHINMFSLGFGGQAKLGAQEYGAIGARLKSEYEYLRNFAQEVEDGKLSDKQIQARIKLYYNNLWQTYEIGRERAHKNADYNWERRRTAPAENCSDCLGYEAQGWVSIGSLPPPGSGSQCRANCLCWKEYKKGDRKPTTNLLDGQGWIGGMTTISVEKLIDAINSVAEPEVQQETSFPAVQVIESERFETDVESLYWGEPTEADLASIQQMTGFDSSPSDWFMVALRCSDNLLWTTQDACWHTSVLISMAKQLPGESLMVDHESSEVDATKGFFLRSLVTSSNSAPLSVIESMGKGKYNRDRITQSGGWIQVYLMAAIPTTEAELISRIKNRQIQDVSTGSFLNGIQSICPHCTQKHGRDIGFYDRDADGRLICPHDEPTPFHKMLVNEGWIDETEVNFADYRIIAAMDGDRHYETSMVGCGNLPGAELYRPKRMR